MEGALIAYLKARLREASTWAGIGAALTATMALHWPYNAAIGFCGVMGVLLRDDSGEEKS